MKRQLECQTCAELITIVGTNLDYIDPDLYHCPTCRTPTGEINQLELENGRTEKLFAYRPDLSEIPF